MPKSKRKEMMKTLWMIAFLLLPVIGISYAGWRVWHILPVCNVWRWVAVALIVLPVIMFFFVMNGPIQNLPLWQSATLYETGTSSIFVLLYLVMLFLVIDIGRIVHIFPSGFVTNNMKATLAIAAIMVGIFTCGYFNYMHKVRQPLALTNTKQPTNVKRIVMLSDLHLGFHNRRKELHRWVDVINAENPDLVLIAGDIIDISIAPVNSQKMSEEFHRITAPVYACLGNHEYYSGKLDCQKFYKEAGIHLLIDSVATVYGINIIGRDDRTNPKRATLHELMSNTDKNLYTILLDHQPYHLEEAEAEGVDFQFSGHTHRGQVWPFSWITDAIFEKSHGKLQKGNTNYYISSGMGIWGGKFRIGTRSEYVVATLEE